MQEHHRITAEVAPLPKNFFIGYKISTIISDNITGQVHLLKPNDFTGQGLVVDAVRKKRNSTVFYSCLIKLPDNQSMKITGERAKQIFLYITGLPTLHQEIPKSEILLSEDESNTIVDFINSSIRKPV